MGRPKLRTKLLSVVLAPLLFLLLSEGILRLVGYRYSPYASEGMVEAGRIPEPLYSRDPDLLFTLPKSTIVDVPQQGFHRVRTNSLGLRGDEPPRSRNPGDYRVLCLGDSVTFGLGVLDREVWPVQLQRMLAARAELKGRRVHVLNGGVPGYSSVQGVMLLERLEWYDPDAIIFWFGVNDAQPAWGRPDSMKIGEPGLATKLASTLGGLRTMQILSEVVDSVRYGENGATRATVEEYAAAVERFRALGKDGRPQVLFMHYPARYGTTEAELAAVIDRAEEGGAKWVNGHQALFIGFAPLPPNADRTGHFAQGPRGLELVIGAKGRCRASLERIRMTLREVRATRRGLAEREALLPEGSVGREEILAGTDPAELVFDNCHLTPLGCRRVARVVADRLVAGMAR